MAAHTSTRPCTGPVRATAGRLARRLRSDERGIALVMSLGILVSLTIALTATLEMTAASRRHIGRSTADQKAFALAEAGINGAIAVASQNASTIKPAPAYPGDPNSTTITLGDGTISWGGTYNGAAKVWTLKAIGTVRNPSGPGAAAVSRTVSAQLRINPPPYSFVSLNQGGGLACGEKHTLLIKLGGQLTVTNTVYSSTCQDDDGFDIFGVGGNLSAPKIVTVGGWETKDVTDTVVAATTWTWDAGTRTVTHTLGDASHVVSPGTSVTISKFTGAQTCFNGTFTVTASSVPNKTISYVIPGAVTCNPGSSGSLGAGGLECPDRGAKFLTASPFKPGCPIKGQALIGDPFAKIAKPTLGAGVTGPILSVVTKKRKSNVVTLTTSAPHGLAVSDSVNVTGVDAALDGTGYTVTSVPSATTFTYTLAGADLPTITAKQLTSNVATLTTSTAHTLAVGNSVTVTGVDTVFNGTYTVTALPSSTSFSFAKARAPFTKTVSNKALSGGVVTLTTSAAHGLFVGDIINVSGVDVLVDGNGFVVTSVPSSTTLTYAAPPPGTVNLTVTKKQLSTGTTAKITTSVAHNLSVGASVTVNIADSRFDGPQTVTAVGGGGKDITYVISAVVENVTSKAITAGTATLTTPTAPRFGVGDTVDVSIGDARFDGSVAVTAVSGVAPWTFSYVPSNATNHWVVASNVATLTATAAHGLQVGDSVTVTYGGAQAFLSGTYTISAVTATTFSYPLVHANGNGNQAGTFTLASLATTAATGTATLTTVPSTTLTGGTPTVTVPAYIAATNITCTNCLSATGNIGLTATSGSFTPGDATPVSPTGSASKNMPGSALIPATTMVSSGAVTLSPPTANGTATYYGGLCIGAPAGTANCSSTNCKTPDGYAAVVYSVAQTGTIASSGSSLTVTVGGGTVIQNGDYILMDTEKMLVQSGGGTASLTVARAQLGTVAAAHTAKSIKYIVGSPNVTLSPGTYIMAGGGFHVCGASVLNAPNVLIYNTEAPAPYNTGDGRIDQVVLNTIGNVTLGPQITAPYAGLTIFQDPGMTIEEAGGNADLQLNVATRRYVTKTCDGLAAQPPEQWDIAFLSMATTGANGPLGSVSGTIYAPAQHAMFGDSVSGKANLALMTGCIYIDGGDSTFDFNPEGLFSLDPVVLGVFS